MNSVIEFEATYALQEQLAERWHEDGCWSYIELFAVNTDKKGFGLIFEAEKQATQELYLITTRTDGTIINMFKEE